MSLACGALAHLYAILLLAAHVTRAGVPQLLIHREGLLPVLDPTTLASAPSLQRRRWVWV